MATQKGIAKRTKPTAEFGLAALGVSGPWEISLDQTTAGPPKWSLDIDGPVADVSFDIASPSVVAEAIEFLTNSGDGRDRLSLAKGKLTPVVLVRDDEFRDRFFLAIGPEDRPVIRLTIANDDLRHVVRALQSIGAEVAVK